MNEKELIEQCRQNSMEAFRSLFDMYSSKAYRTAYLITGHKGLAEDVVQESFLQCFREIKNLRNIDAFKPWFFRIVTRVSWRMNSKEKKYTSLESLDSERSLNYCSQQDYLQDVEFRETCNTVRCELEKLSRQIRTASVLFYFNGMSVKEISRVMNCFESTTKSRLYYARKKISKELSKNSSTDVEELYREGCKSNG